MALGEAINRAGSVLPCPARNIICHAGVERAVLAAGEDGWGLGRMFISPTIEDIKLHRYDIRLLLKSRHIGSVLWQRRRVAAASPAISIYSGFR